MNRITRLRTLAVLTMSGAAMAGGCTALAIAGAAAAGVAGTYIYTEGRLESVEKAPLDRVYEATVRAMQDLEFELKEQSKDALQARVVALRADKSEVKVALEHKADETTDVRIRVGVIGDEAVSRTVLERIRRNLGKSGDT